MREVIRIPSKAESSLSIIKKCRALNTLILNELASVLYYAL